MKRNIEKTIENVRLDAHYCMYASDFKYLMETYNDPFTIIDKAFKYGYALGQRAVKKGGK